MKIPLIFLILFSIYGCAEGNPGGGDSKAWYTGWIKRALADGASFHSEFPLKAGEIRKIELKSEREIKVGLVVKDGYDIFKAGGSIHMGTDKQPRMASGTPGFSVTFTPEGGVVHLRVENTTAIDTRIALHTKPVD